MDAGLALSHYRSIGRQRYILFTIIRKTNALRKHGYDPRIMRLFVIGGGGLLVKNFGQYDASRVTIVSDICANAKGFEYLAQGLLWNRKQAVR